MAYVTYTEYQALYGADMLTETEFNLFAPEAEHFADRLTTGIDNVRKLEVAFPDDEKDAAAVKRCILSVVDDLRELRDLSKATKTEVFGGVVHIGAVSSVSSGSESVSFDNSAKSALASCVGNDTEKTVYLFKKIRDAFSGITDKNGVNLLYMGVYPVCIEIS